MQTITHGYRALSLLLHINWDRVLFSVAILGALMAGAYVFSLGAL